MTRRLALASLALLASSTPTFAQVPFNQNLIPTRTALGRLGLEKQWFTAVPLGGASEKVRTINLAENLLFVQTDAGFLHVYEAETGRYFWGAKLGGQTFDTRPVAINSVSVFVTHDTTLFCLDRMTGQTVWTAKLGVSVANPSREGGTAIGAPAATEDRVMVSLTGGKIVAYNTRPQDATFNTVKRSAGTLAWTWQTGGPILGHPVPAERLVAFASEDHRVYVCQDKPPTNLFRYRTGGAITASMAHYGTRTLIVPCEDQTLYAIDLFTGETKWTVSTGSPIDREPLVTEDLAYAINRKGDMFAIEAKTGQVNWRVPTPGRRLAAMGATRIYVDTMDRDLMILDRKTGSVIATPRQTREQAGVDLREYSVGFTNRQNGRLYFATPSGMLLVLREIGLITPRLLHDPKEPKFGFLPPDGETQIVTPPAAPAVETTPPAETEEKPKEDPKS